MGAKKNYRKIRVFVSSPGDVADERNGIEDVVREVNRTGGFADEAGVFFEVLDWRFHAGPAMGRPEDVILNQIPVESWDIFIGILWSRFGTPPGVNPMIGDQLESGTEEEFILAYDSWKSKRRPNIHFYRCTRDIPYSMMDGVQIKRIGDFFGKFEAGRKYQGLCQNYKETPDFLNQVKRLLESYVRDILNQIMREEREEKRRAVEYPPGARMDAELKADANYEIVFLSTSIRARIIETEDKDTAEKLQIIADHFHRVVYEAAETYGGDQFHWSKYSGVMAFWGGDAHDRAVLAGLKVLAQIPLLNIDEELNPLREVLDIRISAHSGDVIYRIPRFKNISEVSNLVERLENDATEPGTFTITDVLYYQIKNVRLQECFIFNKKKFGKFDIYVYKVVMHQAKKNDEKEDPNYLSKIPTQIDQETGAFLQALYNEMEKNEAEPDLEKFRRHLEVFYGILEKFKEDFNGPDKRWAPEYLAELERCTNSLIEKERNFYNQVEQLCLKWRDSRKENNNLVPISNIMALTRQKSVPFLRSLLIQLTQHMGDGKNPQQMLGKQFHEKIESLIKADDLVEESIFIEIFMDFRIELIDYIKYNKEDPRYYEFLERLWKLADLVLLEDITLPSSQANRVVFQALANAPGRGEYFKAAVAILNQNGLTPDPNAIAAIFRKYDINSENQDLETIFKCMLLYYKFRHQRLDILDQIDINCIWNIVAYYKIRINVLNSVNQYLTNKYEDERAGRPANKTWSPISNPSDLMKVFFGLSHVMLQKTIERMTDWDRFSCIMEMLINFYTFDFFVDDDYFDHLNELRLSLIAKKRTLPEIPTESLDNRMRELEDERNRRKSTRGKGSTDKVRALPLAIQRRLAKSGFSNDQFIRSDNKYIYQEAARKIKMFEVEKALKDPTFQRENLLLVTINHNSYFNVSGYLVVSLLSHPHCPQGYATTKLKEMAQRVDHHANIKNNLTKIAQSAAIPSIKREAARILAASQRKKN